MSRDIAICNDPVHSYQNLTEVAIQTLKKKKGRKKKKREKNWDQSLSSRHLNHCYIYMAAFSTFFRFSWRGLLNSTFPTTEPDCLVISAEDIGESGATLEPLPVHTAALEPQAPCAEMGLWLDASWHQLTALREAKLATSSVWCQGCREVGATDLLPLLALLNPHHQQSSVSAVRC